MRRLGKGRKSTKPVDWRRAPDIKKRVSFLVTTLEMDWIRRTSIICFRSENSKARAYARIWGLSRIWQLALKEKPTYILEVISEKFDVMPSVTRDEILIHELTHIPRNFSGALVPHTKKRKGSFHDKLEGMIRAYRKL